MRPPHLNTINLYLRQRGFGLTEVLIASGILTIVGLGFASLSNVLGVQSQRTKATRLAVIQRNMIDGALRNSSAWAQTAVNNPSFLCIGAAAGCNLSPAPGDNGFYNFVLYSAEAGVKLTYDPADPTSRVSENGGACPGGVDDPSPLCPIKFLAKWKPLCSSYPCSNPAMEIRISLATDFANKEAPINPSNYQYNVIRGVGDDPAQSACEVLGGSFNSLTRACTPKYANQTCASIGLPGQAVREVHDDGTIVCAPIFHGTCDRVTQVLTGVDASGAAICGPKGVPPGCGPVNCVGAWGACSAACGGGTQTYRITTVASGGGAACPFADGATQACNVAACGGNCVGFWTGCSVPCGGGTMTYWVTTPATGSGLACPFASGTTRVCNTGACAARVDCNGTWGACNPASGLQIFTITQFPSGGGAACPASPRTCPVNCVGSWGACVGPTKTYRWTQPPLNGGAPCPYANGQTDTVGCGVCASGRYCFERCHSRPIETFSTCISGTLADCNAAAARTSGSSWLACSPCVCD